MKTPIYENILAELESGERKSIARALFGVLMDHPQGLNRRDLVFILFGKQANENIANDTNDRKIRDTIAAMRSRLIPIVSTSGESGYRLDDSPEARKAMLAEMISRRDRINEQIEAASKVWEIPVRYMDATNAVQARLI
ncbi:MAG: hypothetical protein WCK35_11190 [Chloroflexota bacterium]